MPAEPNQHVASAQPMPSQTPQQAAILQLCLQQAAEGGRAMMDGLLNDARTLAQQRAEGRRDGSQANNPIIALLNRHANSLCGRFPAELLQAFQEASRQQAKPLTLSDLRFDQLELMDDSQVQEKMELARAQQSATLDAEAALSELNALVSAVQGFKSVQPERNPLRPASYVAALQQVFILTGVASEVRLEWLQLTGSALGKALQTVYAQLCVMLKAAAVEPAVYSVTQTPSAAAPGNAGEEYDQRIFQRRSGLKGQRQDVGQNREETLLTVKQLRRLVVGEFDDPGDADDDGAYADPSEKPDFQRSGFEYTVPAALEALQEMQQVGKAMERLAGRRGAAPKRVVRSSPYDPMPDYAASAPPTPFEPLAPAQLVGLGRSEVYDNLRRQAHGVGQVLGLEVVALMVENIANDPRVLPPVQEVVRALETPLLRLAMVDPRFFSDKQHPARRLLETLVEHSARFEAVDNPGFALYLQPLKQVVGELQHVPIEGSEPFELSLDTLSEIWGEQLKQERRQRAQVEDTLRHAEQRNLMAMRIAQEIRERADTAFVPAPVFAFATGPWPQVIAHARLAFAGRQAAPGLDAEPEVSDGAQYMALVGDLFWSVHPELAKADPNRLVKLIPGMLSRMRAGLRLIEYPQVAINDFFDVLMALHQKALLAKPSAPAPALLPEDLLAATSPAPTLAPVAQPPMWLAPSEAQSSGFLLDDFKLSDFSDHQTEQMVYEDEGIASAMAPLGQQALPTDSDATAIAVGSWINITTGGNRMRAQLVWASPEGTMYMFTTATGRNQSMTRRSLDSLIQRGQVQMAPRQNVLGSALDAVARTAMRNSIGKPKG